MKFNMNLNSAALTLCAMATLSLGACSSSVDYNFASSEQIAQSSVSLKATFDPANGLIPQPNNLLFAGTEDGTLNIPLGDVDPADFSNPLVALNALDGWSTTEAITAAFAQSAGEIPTHGLDPATVTIGDSVRVFEVSTDPTTQAVTGILAELGAADVLATPTPDGATLAVVPVKPLKESTTYMVVVTNGIADTTGTAVGRDVPFTLTTESGVLAGPLAALEPVRQLTNAMLAVAANAQQIDPASVVMIWNFTTQSITPVLQSVADSTTPATITVGSTTLDTASVGGAGAADISAGTMNVPYYLDVPTADNPAAPLATFWTGAGGSNLTRFNPNPIAKSTQAIPVLMTTPKGAAPAGGWPIAIFQHGITRNRTDMLAVADAMAQAGMAVIAIDLPMHGVTDTSSPLYIAGQERTFDLDLSNNETRLPKPDGVIDASGTYFYNLQNLLNTRGNLRQSVSDLLTLSASISTLPNINASRKAFIGHSLGAIVGTTFLAYDNSITSASLASPGGSLSRLLAASPAFGPAITAGLAAAGVDVASADGQQFLTAAQTVVDSADPINHASGVTNNTNVHMIQMLQDQTVIGSLTGFPLVGNEPLSRTMGLAQVSTTTQGNGWVRFVTGGHGAILSPGEDNVDLAVTTELQTQVAGYAASGGTNIVITDTSLVEAAQ